MEQSASHVQLVITTMKLTRIAARSAQMAPAPLALALTAVAIASVIRVMQIISRVAWGGGPKHS